MSLRNKSVKLCIVDDVAIDYDYAQLEATLGELADNCVNKYCPMGMFSCPISRKTRCEDVTVEMWAKVFGVKDEDDAGSN